MIRGANMGLRVELKAKGIPFWRVAETLGVSENTVSRWMRVELNESRLSKIKSAIAEIDRGERNARD